MRELQKQREKQKHEVKEDYLKSVDEYQQRFQDQNRQQKESIAIIKDQYKKVHEIYNKKMADMKENLTKESKKLEVSEKRRKLDLEGYSNDLNIMKKKVLFY